MMSLRRDFTEAQERHTPFSSNSVQADWFRESKFGWYRVETSFSEIDHIAKSMGLISGLEDVHIYSYRNLPDSVQLRLTDIPRLRDRCVSWSIVLYEDLFFLTSFCEPRKNSFFLQHIQINLAVDFQALINEQQTIFAHVLCNSSHKPYRKQISCV